MQEIEETPEEKPEPVDLERTYWAVYPVPDIAPAISERVREHFDALSSTGMGQIYEIAHREFYSLTDGGIHRASRIIESGDQGELLQMASNHLRSIGLSILSQTTADRPAYVPKAINGTAQALAQIPTARRLLEYYHTKKGLENALTGAALRALVYGQGFIWIMWDQMAAKGEGDIFYKPLSPLEVVRDPERPPGEHDWFIIIVRRNKWDVAAQYGTGESSESQELYERIIELEDDPMDTRHKRSKLHDNKRTETINEYHFIHAPTPAVPAGRYVITCGEDIVLFEGGLPFDELPVYEMCPEEFLEAGSVGYSILWELVGLQKAFDSLNSTALTNFDAFGTNDLVLEQGTQIGVEEVHSGLNIIRHPPGTRPPQVLEKFAISDGVFKLRDAWLADMQLISGANSTVRGNPDPNLKSGTALALVAAQATQFNSRFQGAFVKLAEKTATGTLKMIRSFMQIPRLGMISGMYDVDGLEAFKADDIDQIDRAEVESGPPILRTVGGKFDVATQLLERGLIDDINQYFQVLETGRLEPVVDPKRRGALRCQQENEMLMKAPPVIPTGDFDPLTGMPLETVEGVRAIVTENPAYHIKHHAAVLDSQEARENPQVQAAVIAHIMEHLRIWRSAPPDLLQLLGYPLPPMQPGDETQQVAPGAEEPTTPQDPNRAQNEEKSKAAGGMAPAEGEGPKIPRPAQPPAEA